MDDMRELLHGAAARPERPYDAEDVRRRVRRRRRRRATTTAVGAVAAVLVGAAGVASLVEGIQGVEDAEVELAPGEVTEPRELDEPRERDGPRAPDDSPDPGEADGDGGTWTELPPAPIDGRSGAEAVWTGEEVIVWGGAPDAGGAAFDPAAGEWRQLPEAPLEPREHHVAVWTGAELVVWGGTEAELPGSADEEGPPRTILGDGAAYDPASDEWRPLPDAPIDGRSMAAAAWTGDELVITGGSAAGVDPGVFEDRRDGAAYDPVEDSWRVIADLPENSAGASAGVWTGDEFVVPVGTHLHPTAAAAYDPAADAWREVPDAPPGPVPASGSALAWTGQEVAVVFGAADPEEQAGQAAAYDPGEDGWRSLPGPPVATGPEPRAVWTGEALAVLSGVDDPEASSLTIARLASDADAWVTEDAPLPARGRPVVAWTGEEVFVWGGVSGDGEDAELHDDGATWRPPPTSE